MSDIPEGIRAKADALAARWVSRGHHDNAALAADIAEALMAERERCIWLMNEYMTKGHSKGDELMAFEMGGYLRNAIAPDKTEAP